MGLRESRRNRPRAHRLRRNWKSSPARRHWPPARNRVPRGTWNGYKLPAGVRSSARREFRQLVRQPIVNANGKRAGAANSTFDFRKYCPQSNRVRRALEICENNQTIARAGYNAEITTLRNENGSEYIRAMRSVSTQQYPARKWIT